MWAYTSVSRPVIDGPTRAICRILQGLRWAHASAWVKLRSPFSGPVRAHRQKAAHAHGGPLRAFRSASILPFENHVGLYISLASCPIM